MNISTLERRPSPTGNELNCTVCGSTSRFAYHHPEADLYRCSDCGHCFSDANSVCDHEEYGDSYHEDSHKNWMENPNMKLFAFLENQIRKVSETASVLDVGCGRAQFLSYLSPRNPEFKLTGIELDQFPVPPGVRLETGDFLEFDFDGRFDCVVSQAVIEHVADVAQFVDRAIELCKPGGQVMIMTLNEQSVLYGTARLLHRFGFSGPFNQLYSKHHLNHFTASSLSRLLTDRGLEIVKRYDHHIPLAAIDFPKQNVVVDAVRKLGARACFALGELTRNCYLQTLVGKTPT